MDKTGGNEGEVNRGKHWATRAGRLVEKPVSRRGRKSGDEVPETDAAIGREISQKSENGEGRARSSGVVYPGKPGPSGPGETGPCGVNRGGSSPMCGTPCCSHLIRPTFFF